MYHQHAMGKNEIRETLGKRKKVKIKDGNMTNAVYTYNVHIIQSIHMHIYMYIAKTKVFKEKRNWKSLSLMAPSSYTLYTHLYR